MAIKFQYNKTSLQQQYKQLDIRVRALPTIKNKESALRAEVKKAKDEMKSLDQKLIARIKQYDYMSSLWIEFDASLVTIEDVRLSAKKIAGVKTPVLDGIDFFTKRFSVFNKPKWFLDGVALIKEIASIAIEKEVFNKKMEILDRARKKTTQKVNLYEKVQIPGYEDAIRKIKRFLEDEENLSKSAQKIVKNRQQQMEIVQ
ncbi:MAG: V-type ATP synthase subunit D [Bacteroidales bacterium]|nr:MAG: V-type ATP synthase subunit D [Bacteroidales bacterium]